MNVDHPTNRRPRIVALLVGLLVTVIITVVGLAGRADASAPTTAPTIAADSAVPTGGSSPATSSLAEAETLASPSVVLIEYAISASAQNIQTGQVFHSFTGTGPISTSFIGTGFFVSSTGFIVTAAHLAAPTAEDQKLSILTELYAEALATDHCDGCGADPARDAANVAANYQLTGVRTQITVFTQDLDLADHPSGLTAALIQSSPVTENDTAVIKVQGSNFPVLPIGDSDTAQVGDPIAVIGYPSTAIDNVDLSTLTSPTVTSGSVTNKPSQGGFARIQSDATVEHGNSGGPMINAAGQVIGIVSNGPTSTTNFFIPSNAVKLVVHEAGVDNSAGQIDSLWREGLAAYTGGHYRQADQLLAQCVALNSIQVGCASYDKLAIGKFGSEVVTTAPAKASSNIPAISPGRGGSSGSGMTLVIIGLLAAVALAVGIALTVRRRGSKVPTPSWTGTSPTYMAAPDHRAYQSAPVAPMPTAQPDYPATDPQYPMHAPTMVSTLAPPSFCPGCGGHTMAGGRCVVCGRQGWN